MPDLVGSCKQTIQMRQGSSFAERGKAVSCTRLSQVQIGMIVRDREDEGKIGLEHRHILLPNF